MKDGKSTGAKQKTRVEKVPSYTSSNDAVLPNENIISAVNCDALGKWVAVQCNPDGSLHTGVGNTEPLARRIAALEGLQSGEKDSRQLDDSVFSAERKKYLRWKDNLRDITTRQARIIDLLLHGLHTRDKRILGRPDKLASEQVMADTIILMIQAIGVSLHSIQRLSDSDEMTIRDCYPIARSVVETVINVAFIMASGTEMAERAQQHTLQKYYRDLNREAEVGGLRIELKQKTIPPLESVPGLQDAIDKFTTKNGGEIPTWNPNRIDGKIEAVITKYGESAGIGLTTAKFAIYRHSSEVLHGSHFGAKYFWQPTFFDNSSGSPEVFSEHLFNHFLTIFNGTFFSVNSLFEIFDIEYGMPELTKASNELLDELKNMEFMSDTHTK